MRRHPEPPVEEKPTDELDRLLDEVRAAIDAGLQRLRDERNMQRAGVDTDRRTADAPIDHPDRRATPRDPAPEEDQ